MGYQIETKKKFLVLFFLITPVIQVQAYSLSDAHSAQSYVYDQVFNQGHASNFNALGLGLYNFYQRHNLPISQTEAHLIRHVQKKRDSVVPTSFGCTTNLLRAFIDDSILRQVAYDIIAIEKREAALGRYTFVHGQPWFLQFYEDLYTFLWQTVTGIAAKDFYFLRFKNLYNHNIHQKLAKSKKNRVAYIRKGTPGYYNKKDSNYLMFLNYALFNNQWGSSSARYIAKGDSENGVRKWLTTRKMFYYHGLDTYYDAFAHELELLRKKHHKLTQHKKQTYGNAFVISCEPQMVDKVVYTSWIGTKTNLWFANNTKTDRVKKIVDTLRTNPFALADEMSGYYHHSDHIEFCLVLSLDGGLKPNNGVYFFNIPPVKKRVWDKYIAERDALFARIKQSIAQQEYGQVDSSYWQTVVQALYA